MKLRPEIALALGLVATLGCRTPLKDTTRTSYPAWPVAETVAYDSSIESGVMDVYLPTTAATTAATTSARRPAVLALHGGAWVWGDKSLMAEVAGFLCPAGYVVLAPNYRLSLTTDPPRPDDAAWPAQLEDCRAALAYARAHADRWNIDPDRIASFGESAGGNLALMLCFRDAPDGSRVKVAVDVSGPTDFTHVDNSQYFQQVEGVTGHPGPWSPAELQEISPLFFTREDASVLIIHGIHDSMVDVQDADELAGSLRALGADTEYDRVDGRAGYVHNDLWTAPDVSPVLATFLATRLQAAPTQ